MFSESTSGYRTAVEPQDVKTGRVIPLLYDLADVDDPPPPRKMVEGLQIASFAQFHKRLKGPLPSGKLWDVYRVIFDVNLNLQRLVALPPGSPQAALDALQAALTAVNNDKDFAAEASKKIDFAPDMVTGPDTRDRVRAMLQVSPEIREFVDSYITRKR
jgi:hypothetical protein